MTITSVLRMRLEASEKADALGLLEAVRLIAKSGGRRHRHEWIKDWGGKRYFYGDRAGDEERPYAEIAVLRHESDSRPDLVTSAVVLYSRQDNGETICYRPGNWTDEVLAEAARLRKAPKTEVAAAPIEAESANFAPYHDRI
jgi:hypothetical protein